MSMATLRISPEALFTSMPLPAFGEFIRRIGWSPTTQEMTLVLDLSLPPDLVVIEQNGVVIARQQIPFPVP